MAAHKVVRNTPANPIYFKVYIQESEKTTGETDFLQFLFLNIVINLRILTFGDLKLKERCKYTFIHFSLIKLHHR